MGLKGDNKMTVREMEDAKNISYYLWRSLHNQNEVVAIHCLQKLVNLLSECKCPHC